ncbi:MAG: hypothetical protein JW744_04070 [Candidatus Diapherotrites archaeon]|uniref:DNA primase small subunit PriS n=1 Tax=Candidatus Iainarchaeum sp. TaxID=3101447 RepID=A0A938YT53_9ARCH|nr:hypothetical protein [Candidatus Diapherotrites archaeon]
MAGEQEFLQQHFRKFYSEHKVNEPPEPASREFGIGSFGQKISRRHLAFKSLHDFNSFLRQEVPFFVSYSSALYKFPERRPMPAKEMLAADLVYEFDADDLPTACKQQHDSWKCPKCGRQGKGRQLMCDECGTQAILEEWFCPQCLGEARKKVFNLLEFLQDDFGFSEGIAINFSGRAGYHVHVRNKEVRSLSPSARIELIDYLTANSLSIFSHFRKEGELFAITKKSERSGWGRRIMSSITELLEEGDASKIAVFGSITTSQAKRLLSEKEMLLKSINERGVLPAFFGRASPSKESQSDKFWQSFIQSVIERISPIDRQTSIDVSKIVRVPETIHGETGLVAKTVSIDELKGFDPLVGAVGFGPNQTVKVFIIKAPRFHLAGESFGPFENQEAELPLNAAIFLLGRASARLAGS